MIKNYRNSLKKKTMLVMIAAFTIVGIASVCLFYQGSLNIARAEYVTHCSDLANTVSKSLDIKQVETISREVLRVYRSLEPSGLMLSDQIDEEGYDSYLANYAEIQKMPQFNSLRNTLRRSQDVAHVECLYITYPDIETHRLIYLVDGAHEDVWDPGTLEILYDTDFQKEGDITSGFGSLMSETEEGITILTTAVPVYNYNNEVIAYVGLDYSMENLLESQRHFMVIAILMIALLSGISAFVVIKLVDRSIVKPINALSDASVQFYSELSDKSYESHQFSSLNINTGDEIQTLADSMAKMERDIDDHIQALLSTRRELSDTKEYAEEMAQNAYRDSLTGVKNKRAYESAISELNDDISTGNISRFGIAVVDMNDLKLINDNFGHECGDASISRMCRVICDVFKRSPVYRYGGDEFAVILKDHDLESVSSLIKQFHHELSSLRRDNNQDPWLRINAAIGYSEYDPSVDTDASSVFERADKEMYKNKQSLKAV